MDLVGGQEQGLVLAGIAEGDRDVGDGGLVVVVAGVTAAGLGTIGVRYKLAIYSYLTPITSPDPNYIDAPVAQRTEQEIARVISVSQEQITTLQGVEYRAKQRLLVAALAAVAPDRGIEYHTTAQAHDPHHPAQRKPQAGLLAAWLRIGALIGGGVGHRHGGAIDQAHRPAPPMPRRERLRGYPAARGANQRRDHCHG